MFYMSIKYRLLRAFLLMVILPATAITIVSVQRGLEDGQAQILRQLESVVTLKEAEINTWVQGLHADLAVVLIGDEVIRSTLVLLEPSQEKSIKQTAQNLMRAYLDQVLAHNHAFGELFLINIKGQVILSTNPVRTGQHYMGQTFFKNGLLGPYIRPLSYPIQAGRDTVIVVAPVYDEAGQPIGVLGGRASTAKLNEIMAERTGLGRTGVTYLVGRNHMMLTEPQVETGPSIASIYVFSEGTDVALEASQNGNGSYKNYHGVDVLGVYHWLPDLEVALLAEQERSEAFQGLYNTLWLNMVVAAAAVLIAVIASLSFTKSISDPLTYLANTAAQIAAGDLDRTVSIQRTDEIGTLAHAFKRMTTQLRTSINDLEQRVGERTWDLQKANALIQQKALQLETVAQLSQQLTSILDIQELLRKAIDLIQDAFGYYSVNIFLLNNEADTLVLQSVNKGLQQRKEVYRNLPIGGRSLNSKAVKTNQVVVVNDVSQDHEYLPDDGLTVTRSEAIIPLRARGQIIGTLDIQSADINAFSPEDELILQSLGNQVAIAIENARLYESSHKLAVLEERSRLARELHDTITQALFSLDLHAKALKTYFKKDMSLAEEQVHKIRQITHDTLQEMRSLIFDLRPGLIEQIGLIPALKRLIEQSRCAGGPELLLHVTGEPKLPPEVERGLYRIAQEGINNAIKHAHAHQIEVQLEVDDGEMMLSVRDDGTGFDLLSLKPNSRSLGLLSMKERAKLMNAELIVDTRQGEGTRLEVHVPVVG
jgi:nitrate/nitrite-specific signal transduction histidine kinase